MKNLGNFRKLDLLVISTFIVNNFSDFFITNVFWDHLKSHENVKNHESLIKKFLFSANISSTWAPVNLSQWKIYFSCSYYVHNIESIFLEIL